MSDNTESLNALLSPFRRELGSPEWIVKSPCRVNIIGEHTDYHDGLVFPFAANRFIYFLASTSARPFILLKSRNFRESVSLPLQKQPVHSRAWYRYFQSAINTVLAEGYQLGGLCIHFGGNIPIGAGLSSSSSITCGFIFLLNEAFSLNLSKMDLVHLASKAENATGLEGGKMDQFTILHGKEHHAILLDCHDFHCEMIPVSMDEIHFVLFNTNVRHNLVETDYNLRKKECLQGFELIRQRHTFVSEFRQITEEMVAEIRTIDPVAWRRLKHYVSENARVIGVKELLNKGTILGIGDLLLESHDSLKNDYEVSCPELDFVIGQTSEHPDCYGGRMMGGGFGGCTIHLIKKGSETEIFKSLQSLYIKKFRKHPDMYVVKPVNGVILFK